MTTRTDAEFRDATQAEMAGWGPPADPGLPDKIADLVAARLADRLPPAKPLGDLLAMKEAAAHCATSLSNFKLWSEAGYFPRVQRGRYVRFRRRDLDAFLDRHSLQAVRSPRQKRRMGRGEGCKIPSPLLP